MRVFCALIRPPLRRRVGIVSRQARLVATQCGHLLLRHEHRYLQDTSMASELVRNGSRRYESMAQAKSSDFRDDIRMILLSAVRSILAFKDILYMFH